MDIENLTVMYILQNFGIPDVIWASFDCTTYSIAGIRHHRKVDGEKRLPKSEYALKCDNINKNVLRIIDFFVRNHNTIYFIENPRGVLRKMDFMQNLPRYTVTYCQYGDDRMKPTDIWTNHPFPNFKPMCKNGDPCHTSAPRGSRTGTQGRKNKFEKSKIPKGLIEHIVNICELHFSLNN